MTFVRQRYTTRDESRYYKNLKQNMGTRRSIAAVQIRMLKRNPRLHRFSGPLYSKPASDQLADKR